MPQYEYKVVPAPSKGLKAKGVRGPEARFAHALEELMNRMGAEGWEYQRAETLPAEERHGLTNVTTTYRNMLVFRRPRGGTLEEFQPRLLDAPAPAPLPAPESQSKDDVPDSFFGAARDNGVEDAEDMDTPAASVLKARAARLKADEKAPKTPPTDPDT